MKNALLFGCIIIVVLSGVRISEGKEKKTAAAPAAAAKADAKGVWKDVKSNSPDAKVSYKLDGSYIIISFKNVSKDKSLRIRYQAKWKKNQNGKWIEEASAEGMGVRLKKSEDITKEVRTHSKEIKDVVIEIDVTEG
jgi:hypothetical protein